MNRWKRKSSVDWMNNWLTIFCWSGWGDSNARPLRPERSALPTALHPDKHLFGLHKRCLLLKMMQRYIFFPKCMQIYQEKFAGLMKKPYLCTRNRLQGTLAQVVEQWTENPCVLGSTPRGTTSSFHSARFSSRMSPGFPFSYQWLFWRTMPVRNNGKQAIVSNADVPSSEFNYYLAIGAWR